MKIQRFLLVVVIILSLISLPACRLPASTQPPAVTPTAEGGFPVPGTETLGIFEKIATETAQAGGVAPESPSPAKPGGKEETPAPTPKPPKPTTQPEVVPTKKSAKQPAPPEVPSEYTLQKGEFIYCIARRFDIDPDAIMAANKLNRNSTVYPGMKLSIPKNAKGFPGERSLHKHPTTYTVRAGDTIYTIACYYGDVYPSQIAKANGLKSPYKLTSGESIKIP